MNVKLYRRFLLLLALLSAATFVSAQPFKRHSCQPNLLFRNKLTDVFLITTMWV